MLSTPAAYKAAQRRFHRAADVVTLHAALMHFLPTLRVQEELAAAIERARAALDDATFDAAGRRGAAMDFRDMTGFAGAEIELALAAVA